MALTGILICANADNQPFGMATNPGNGTTRYYGTDGRYQGSATTQGNTTRYWGKNGTYQGSGTQSQNGNVYYYNAGGQFKGNSTGN